MSKKLSDCDDILALTGPQALLLVGELVGGMGMLSSFVQSKAQEPATPDALMVTALREIRHAADALHTLAVTASMQAINDLGVAPERLAADIDDPLTRHN